MQQRMVIKTAVGIYLSPLPDVVTSTVFFVAKYLVHGPYSVACLNFIGSLDHCTVTVAMGASKGPASLPWQSAYECQVKHSRFVR